jgi:glyoxylase-like metal-dependent hydrolase (beta-lactamase superfamily II)
MKTNFTLDNALGMPNARVREAVEPAHICGRLPDEIDPDSYSIHAFQITEFVKEGYRIDLGGRILEVVLTPGHTPDSLCLLDRKNGLLFSGDTFYAGPIYLVTPAGDLGAYAKSVEKLAKLAATLELLLPAHNEPFADPSYLKKLSVAVRQIQTGGAQPKVDGSRREFVFEGFSLVLAAGK